MVAKTRKELFSLFNEFGVKKNDIEDFCENLRLVSLRLEKRVNKLVFVKPQDIAKIVEKMRNYNILCNGAYFTVDDINSTPTIALGKSTNLYFIELTEKLVSELFDSAGKFIKE